MVGGGGYWNHGGAAAQQWSTGTGGKDFASGFVAGYNSCVPQVHYHGYTHPI